MACEAFVMEDSHYNKDPDGEMDEHSNRFAWVFPEGLGVGRPAQYHERKHRASGFPRYGCVDTSRSELLAEGSVASIAGAQVTFAWVRAVAQQDDSPWRKVAAPAAVLTRAEENQSTVERRSSYRRSAQMCKGFKISAPEAAWALLRPHVFVATLSACEMGPDEQLTLTLTTMSGEDVSLNAAPDSTAAAVAALLAEERGLGSAKVVLVTAGGAQLAPDAQVQAALPRL